MAVRAVDNNFQKSRLTKNGKNPFVGVDVNSLVKPKKARGYMLPSRVFDTPVSMACDLKDDVVALSKGITGKANDHEIGKANGLAMKLGALGLASYLFVKNPLKLKKSMEFVGVGSFLAAMALWPKLAIQAPLKAATGVDIHQRYVDSQGRKKMFFQDAQYVAWDAMEKEDLHRMGDKMGIPRDIHDREDLIKKKATKIATQGNTLWMLTAGVATPVLSALMCNQAEKLLAPALEKQALNSTANQLKNLEQVSGKFLNNSAGKNLDKFLNKNKNEVLNSNTIQKLSDMISMNSSLTMGDAVKSELSKIAKSASKPLDASFASKLLESNKDLFASNNIDVQKLGEFVKSQGENIVLNSQNKGEFAKSLANFVKGDKNLNSLEARKLNQSVSQAVGSAMEMHNAVKVGDAQNSIKEMFNTMNGFVSKKSVIDNFIDARVGDRAETFIANQWERVNNTFMKAIGINGKDLATAKIGEDATRNLVKSKLEALAKTGNEKEYQKAIQSLGNVIGKYDSVLSNENFQNLINDNVNKVYTEAGKNFQKGGFEEITKAILGHDTQKGLTEDVAGSLKNLVKSDAKDRVLGAQTSFYRMLQSVDLYKKIESGAFNSQMQFLTGLYPETMKNVNTSAMIELLKGGSVELSKNEINAIQDCTKGLMGKTLQLAQEGGKTILSGDKESWKNIAGVMEDLQKTTKASRENILATAADKCKNVILDAKITEHTEKLDDVGQAAFKAVSQMLYGSELSPETVAALGESGKDVVKNLEAYKKQFTNDVSNWQQWAKPNHSLNGQTNAINGKNRHLLVGSTITDMVKSAAENKFNTNKWLKIFGVTMVALVGVTFIAEKFFGKMKEDKNVATRGQN